MKPSATVQTRRPTATRIRPATAHDLDALDGIYAHARRFMAQTGNPTQWGPNEPSREELAASINAGTLFVGTNEDNAPCSTFVLITTPEPTYQHINPYRSVPLGLKDGPAPQDLGERVAERQDPPRARGAPTHRHQGNSKRNRHRPRHVRVHKLELYEPEGSQGGDHRCRRHHGEEDVGPRNSFDPQRAHDVPAHPDRPHDHVAAPLTATQTPVANDAILCLGSA